MKHRYVLSVVAGTLVACFALVGLVQAAETYKMGISIAITGPTADSGSPYAKGVEDYVRYANDIKLLGDAKIEVDIRDDSYKTDVTKRNFEEFIDNGIVLFLGYATGATMALKTDFEEVKIPVIPASFHAGNLVDSDYIFLPCVSYSGQMIGLAEYVIKNHQGGDKPKVALFIHPSAFGRGPVEDTQKAIEKGLNIEIVEVVEHGQDLDDTGLIQRLLKKGVKYVITHTMQSPVATLLKDAERLDAIAKSFGEQDKLTFLGGPYSGGNDLIVLAGSSAEGFLWSAAYRVTSDPGPGTDAQLALAKRYDRDDKIANSHNYTNGLMVTQVAVETMRRVLAKGQKITKEALYQELFNMNGFNAYYPVTTVGPVTYSETDREGVDTMQIYKVSGGTFRAEGAAFIPDYVAKIK